MHLPLALLTCPCLPACLPHSKFLRPGEDDEGICQRLTVEAGVTVIPVSGVDMLSIPQRHTDVHMRLAATGCLLAAAAVPAPTAPVHQLSSTGTSTPSAEQHGHQHPIS